MSSARPNLIETLMTGSKEELMRQLLDIFIKCRDENFIQVTHNIKNQLKEILKDEEKSESRYWELSLAIGQRLMEFGGLEFKNGQPIIREFSYKNPANESEEIEAKSYGMMWIPVEERHISVLHALQAHLPVYILDNPPEEMLDRIHEQVMRSLQDISTRQNKSPEVSISSSYKNT